MEQKTNKRVVVVHHHIFKNAGTSFNYALKQAFGKNFLEYDLPNSQVVTKASLSKHIEDNPNAVAISGHHIALPSIEADGFKTISSVIVRDPLARVRSIYKFERKQNAQTEGAMMAKKLDFKDFVEWRLRDSPHVFCNYQTLYCSRINGRRSRKRLSSEDFYLAIENLNQCFAVGTVKRYREFLMMAQYEVSKYFPSIFLRNSHLNVSSKPATTKANLSVEESLANDLGEGIVAELKERNQFDTQLYELANQLLSEWIRSAPDIKEKHFEESGTSFIQQKQWQNAKDSFQNAIAFSTGKSSLSYHGLGEACEKLGDVEMAVRYYRKSIDMKPDFAWSYFRLGNIFYKQEAFEEAINYYSSAVKVHPENKSFILFIGLGNALAKLNKIGRAIEAYQRADDICPTSFVSKARLARIYASDKQNTKSDEYVNKALELVSDKGIAYAEIGDAFAEYSDDKEAARYYRKGLESNSSSNICAERLSQCNGQSALRKS